MLTQRFSAVDAAPPLGEGLPTPKPTTTDFCSWVPGSRGPRNSSTVAPASSLTFKKLPRSKEAAKVKTNLKRQYNMIEGLDYRYDLFGSTHKVERLNSHEYTSAPRLANLFAKLRAAQSGDGKEEEEEDS